MNASHIKLSSVPSLCKNFSRSKFDEVLVKIILHSFLRHGV